MLADPAYSTGKRSVHVFYAANYPDAQAEKARLMDELASTDEEVLVFSFDRRNCAVLSLKSARFCP